MNEIYVMSLYFTRDRIYLVYVISLRHHIDSLVDGLTLKKIYNV